MSNALELNKNNFADEVLKSTMPVLVDFWASWCGPCQMLGPILKEVDKELNDKVMLGKVNVDENQKLSQEYKIDAIPAVFIFKNGKAVEKIIGLQTKDFLVNKLKSLVD